MLIKPLLRRPINLCRFRCYSNEAAGFLSTKTQSEKDSSKSELLESRKAEVTNIVYPMNGVPEAARSTRQVLIARPEKSAMTSGRSHINDSLGWHIQFDNGQERWENPLIGWTSTRDTLGQLAGGSLRFAKAQDAINFAQKNGWSWKLVQPEITKWKIKSYSDNYRYSFGPLRQISTK